VCFTWVWTLPGRVQLLASSCDFRSLSGVVFGRISYCVSADVRFIGQGKNAHRKACLMVRQDLEADAPYADVAVHGDGLISLQYRPTRGGPTLEVKSPVKNPATVRLERRGDRFTLCVARQGEPLHAVGAVTVVLENPAYAGLAVGSHEPEISETAIFSNVVYSGP